MSEKVVSRKELEMMDEYRYLGVFLDNILHWKCNTGVYKKEQGRLLLEEA